MQNSPDIINFLVISTIRILHIGMLDFLRKYSERFLIVSVKMRTDICDVICVFYLFCIRHPLQFSFLCKDTYSDTKERTIGSTSLFYATFVSFLPSFFVDLDGSGQTIYPP